MEKRKNKKQNKPKVISLFSGCGGLDLGFNIEGYELFGRMNLIDGLQKPIKKILVII